jgi:hypothetical protein
MADIDARMQKLLDDRDRYQLKLEDVEEKAENLESSKQDVLTSGGTWIQSHEKKYTEKAQRYAKKVERYQKHLEDIDEQIDAYNDVDGAAAARRRTRFSVGGGSMKTFASGMAATGAGLRRRIFNNDGKPSGHDGSLENGDVDDDDAADDTASIDRGGTLIHDGERSSTGGTATMDSYDRLSLRSAGKVGMDEVSQTSQRSGDSMEQPKSGRLRSSADTPTGEATSSRLDMSNIDAPDDSRPPQHASDISNSTRFRSVGDTDSIGSESAGSRVSAGGKKSRFTFWTGKDKVSHGSLVNAGGAQLGEHDAVSELMASIRDLRAKALEAHSMSERSSNLRDEQGAQLRELEARLAARDAEVAELQTALETYDKRIEGMVIKYEQQLQVSGASWWCWCCTWEAPRRFNH